MTPFERKDMPYLIGAFVVLIVFVAFAGWHYS